VRSTCSVPAVAVNPVGAGGGVTAGVALASIESGPSPPAFGPLPNVDATT
jgi:hypothetical protein